MLGDDERVDVLLVGTWRGGWEDEVLEDFPAVGGKRKERRKEKGEH